MWQANVSAAKEFQAMAEYLDLKGWIAEGGNDYRYFIITPADIVEATR